MVNPPYLQYSELAALGAVGGYSNMVSMSEQTNVFLLSAMTVIKMRFVWQTSINPIPDGEYEDILEFIQEVEAQLMNNIAIGSFFWSIATLTSPDVLPVYGQLIAQLDYPELSAIVPASWLSGVNIQLPNLKDTGFIGDSVVSNIGGIIGANTHQLTVAELAAHTHIQNPHTHTYTQPISVTALGGEIPATASLVTTPPTVTGSATATNQNTGGDTPHNNIQQSMQLIPYIVVQ